MHTLKPGYLVHAKVSLVFDNGIEVAFLGGFKGNIFADHLEKDLKKYKVGEKMNARIIAIDPLSKNISLSLLPHIMKL